MNDYHRYVREGKFEEMWRECEDPWNASHEDYDASLCSLATKHLVWQHLSETLVSIGSGNGRHMAWLGRDVEGVEISKTARIQSRNTYPAIPVHMIPMAGYGIYLFREVLWYMLDSWHTIPDAGALVIVELSFYDNQQYGLDYFNGPDDFVAKWPFTIEKIVREHTTKHQREGRIMVAGRI